MAHGPMRLPAPLIRITVAGPPTSVPLHDAIRLAGRSLTVDRPLLELAPFRAVAAPAVVATTEVAGQHPSPWRRKGSGSLGSGDIGFTVDLEPDSGYTIGLGPGLRLQVAADGSSVALIQPCTLPLEDPAIAQSLLGPGLLLALALKGTFAFHASAAAFAGRAAVFLGDSGAGKSTLAAALDRRGAVGWTRLADDVLPVTLAATGRIDALPAYPQLKLAPREQYVADGRRPERLPVAAVYLLEEPGAGADHDGGADAVTLMPASPRDALLALTAHTMAVRLFAPSLAARHFAFCASAVGVLPVKRLRYPRQIALLDAVVAAVEADLAARQGAGGAPKALL